MADFAIVDDLSCFDQAPRARPSGLRSRAVRISLVALVVLATLMIALPVRGLVGGGSAFTIRRVDRETVSIRIVDPAVPAEEMTEQLREAGLDVSVSVMPASPQLVGTWLPDGFGSDLPDAAEESVRVQLRGYVRTLELPVPLPGSVRLTVGAARRGSRQPLAFGRRNALAPGGVLACRSLSGADPAETAERLRAAGFAPVFVAGTRVDSPTLERVPSGTRVTAAFLEDVSPTTVRLVLDRPGSRRYSSRIGLGFPPSDRHGQTVIDRSCH